MVVPVKNISVTNYDLCSIYAAKLKTTAPVSQSHSRGFLLNFVVNLTKQKVEALS